MCIHKDDEKRWTSRVVVLATLMIFWGTGTGLCQPRIIHRISTNQTNFLIDGKPFQIISGEMHYSRIPRAFWRDRLKKARAMGLNTISTYVFWNIQEPRPGVYDFSGNNDVATFIRMAQEEGLYVILRPGPYVCAEWDLGGLPSWLLADPKAVLRSTDPHFMVPVRQWLMRLGKELAPLQASRGGPIIAIQVENEYGSFGSDHEYMRQIRDAIVKSGLGEVLLYTADGPDELPNGAIPEVQAVVNFGPGDAQSAFAALKKFRPDEPLMAGEYWDGWFDHWGGPHHVTDTAQQVKDLSWILSRGYSVNLYMFEGGTTFGFMNGANIDDRAYHPDTTSYDYDAALDEAGRPTPKYYAFRSVIAKHDSSRRLPPVPTPTPVISIADIPLTQSLSLWRSLPTPIESARPKPLEEVGESYGYILYRKHIAAATEGKLVLGGLHDYAVVYVNGRQVGTLDRRLSQTSLQVTIPTGARLDILVENTGRVNYGPAIRTEQAGITESVSLNGQPLTDWQIYSLPMKHPATLRFSRERSNGPAFYRGTFRISRVGDTFLDTNGLGKGAIWVNEHALGRFWNIGPQRTLCLPGAWLRKGSNEVIVFDLFGEPGRRLKALDHPVLHELN